jgi:hypothetical protein
MSKYTSLVNALTVLDDTFSLGFHSESVRGRYLEEIRGERFTLRMEIETHKKPLIPDQLRALTNAVVALTNLPADCSIQSSGTLLILTVEIDL